MCPFIYVLSLCNMEIECHEHWSSTLNPIQSFLFHLHLATFNRIFSKSVVDCHVSVIWWLHHINHHRFFSFSAATWPIRMVPNIILGSSTLIQIFQHIFLCDMHFVAVLGSLLSIISTWAVYCFCTYRIKKNWHTVSPHCDSLLKTGKWICPEVIDWLIDIGFKSLQSWCT